MTFYNIIFGILFVDASRELLQALFERQWRQLVMALTVALFVANDTIYTSHAIESVGISYSISMKLIDFMLFLLLAVCIVLMSPENNLLGVRSKSRIAPSLYEPKLWSLLSLFWGLSLLWDWIGFREVEREYFLLFIPLLAMIVLSARWPVGWVASCTRLTIPLLLVLYIFYLTPRNYN